MFQGNTDCLSGWGGELEKRASYRERVGTVTETEKHHTIDCTGVVRRRSLTLYISVSYFLSRHTQSDRSELLRALHESYLACLRQETPSLNIIIIKLK